MNKLERAVYDAVKSNPRIKLGIRNLYQSLFDLFPTPSAEAAYPLTCREGYFFGFHDHSPFSSDNCYMAAGQFDIAKPLHMPELGENLEIGVFWGDDFKTWQPVSFTKTWNWHQGCKLQWLGAENSVIFNDHMDGQNISRIVSASDSRNATVLPGAIGSVSPSGEWAVGYSFERVEKYMPGYGYRYETDREDLCENAPDSDGVFIFNIAKQQRDLVITIRQLSLLDPELSMEGAHHYFSHALFSPSSQRFAFLHRWIKGDVTKRWSRIVTADVNGENIRIYPTQDMASHLGWRNDNELLVYCRLSDGRDRYVLFNDNEPESYQILGEESFNSDGHPAWSVDGRFFITDTYPDRRRVQNLVLYDGIEHKRYNLAKVPTFKKFASLDPYKHWSCDLHPRWDRSGRYICFDATYSGQRSLCTLDLGAPVSEISSIGSL